VLEVEDNRRIIKLNVKKLIENLRQNEESLEDIETAVRNINLDMQAEKRAESPNSYKLRGSNDI
jgi:hypothetical protein